MDDKKLLFIVNPRAGKTKSLAPLFDAAASQDTKNFRDGQIRQGQPASAILRN